MTSKTPEFTLIESTDGLERFARDHRNAEWLCFDTEFIGERRFYTLLCLIQLATPQGFFLIDPLKVKDLQPLLDLITNPAVLKITHAGENDYRLLNNQFGIVPHNTFDTQIAAGFVGYRYPLSFQKLLEAELGVKVSKSYTVTDWDVRPFRPKQLRYALNDVIHLPKLWRRLAAKLEELGRESWLREECQVMERPEYYEQDPHRELLNSNLARNLSFKEKVFLLRLFDWRTEEAKRLNHSREMVLPGKHIGNLVRAVSSGREALLSNRRISDRLVQKYGDTFLKMFEAPPTPEEKAVIRRLHTEELEDPEYEILMEMLHLLVRYKCLKGGLSPALVLSRTVLNKMKADKDYREPALKNGWRRSFLGDELVEWLDNRKRLRIDFSNGRFQLKLD